MDDFLYMLAIVAVGFALNFGLRALPFALFSTRKGPLPPWIERFGAIISPIIIAGLIVYSYSGLQWKTLWPYLAGALTVGLQVWKRNPLASIVAGTVLYMCLVSCGCSTTRAIDLNAENPSVRVTKQGTFVGETKVRPIEVPELLKDNDIPKTRCIHILLEDDVRDLGEAKLLMALLAKRGWTRPVLVTKRHGESFTTGKKKSARVGVKSAERAPATPKKIRYKKATE